MKGTYFNFLLPFENFFFSLCRCMLKRLLSNFAELYCKKGHKAALYFITTLGEGVKGGQLMFSLLHCRICLWFGGHWSTTRAPKKITNLIYVHFASNLSTFASRDVGELNF